MFDAQDAAAGGGYKRPRVGLKSPRANWVPTHPASNPPAIIAVEDYHFTPADLAAAARPLGICAFMRVKNGADFGEAAIRSHIDYFDEIAVASSTVYFEHD